MEGFGGVGGGKVLEPCPGGAFPMRHGGLWGGVVEVVGGAGGDFLDGVEAVVPLSPARFPYPPQPATELL